LRCVALSQAMDLQQDAINSFSSFGWKLKPDLPPFGLSSSFPNANVFTQHYSIPTKHTLEPYVTGASVLAVTYQDGVMLGADTLGSYGSLARFRQLRRLRAVGPYTVVGATGEYSDFQFLHRELEVLIKRDWAHDDSILKSPRDIHNYLARRLYNQRNRFDPFWNQLVVAGFKDQQAFLGYVDLHGTNYEDVTLATGYGAHLARPILRNVRQGRPNLSEEEARKALEDCMRVLYYRDARALNKIQLAKVTAKGVEISEPYALTTNWSLGIKPGELVVM
jgi:20S proteasome subunit beta 7